MWPSKYLTLLGCHDPRRHVNLLMLGSFFSPHFFSPACHSRDKQQHAGRVGWRGYPCVTQWIRHTVMIIHRTTERWHHCQLPSPGTLRKTLTETRWQFHALQQIRWAAMEINIPGVSLREQKQGCHVIMRGSFLLVLCTAGKQYAITP